MKKKIALLSMLILASGSLSAQASDAEESPLDDLLATPISTAARYEQVMSDVPASVTVITSEEIERYGWHTLADVLASVPGVYTSYDRWHSMLGVRGVGLPSDWNNRFLVLIDGHRVLDVVTGSAGIGTALGVDLSTISRIEFVRGPSSVLYGAGAMFGVINLIPKDEEERSSLMIGRGSNGLQIANGRAGVRRGDLAASVAASWQERNGGDLYFHEFDSPQTNHGVASDRDWDDYRRVMATFGWRRVRFIGLNFLRVKGIPTALFGTDFNGGQQASEARTLLGVRFDHDLGPGKSVSLRGHFDRFAYAGDFPARGLPYNNETESTHVEAGGQYVWDPRPNHRLTTGVQWTRSLRSSYGWGVGSTSMFFDDRPFTVVSGYTQSDWQPSRRISITAGGSVDHYSHRGTNFTPRLAVLFHPGSRSTVKLLYGEGFRMPNVFEVIADSPIDEDPLQAERIHTAEIAFEHRLTPEILATGSVYSSHIEDVLRQTFVDGVLSGYVNGGHITSRGFELQLDYRRHDGIWCYGSYSRQIARREDERMQNSPGHLLKAGVSTPTSRPTQAAFEVSYASSRETYGGATTGEATIANLNMTRALTPFLSVGATVRNLFDVDYALPAGPQHVQDTLAQDGRTFVVKLMLRGK